MQAEAPPADDDLVDAAAEVVDLGAALSTSVAAAKARRAQAGTTSGTNHRGQLIQDLLGALGFPRGQVR